MWKACYMIIKTFSAGLCHAFSQVVRELLILHLTLKHSINNSSSYIQNNPLTAFWLHPLAKTPSHNSMRKELWLGVHCLSFKMHVWFQMKPRYTMKFPFVTQRMSTVGRIQVKDICVIKILSLKYFRADSLLWHSLSCLWNELITVILFYRSHTDSHSLWHVRKLQMEMKQEGE